MKEKGCTRAAGNNKSVAVGASSCGAIESEERFEEEAAAQELGDTSGVSGVRDGVNTVYVI